MRASGIYRIRLADGRCYVGQSVNMHTRWAQHRSKLRRGLHWLPHLQNCWNKYGEDAFIFEVLEQCAPERMTEREQWWMDELKPAFNVAPRAESLAGYKRPFRNLTPEHRAKIAAAHRLRHARIRAGLPPVEPKPPKVARPPKPPKPYRLKIYRWQPPRTAEDRARVEMERRAKISAKLKGRPAPMRGRKHSAESRAKISASLMGNKYAQGLRQTPEHRANIAAGVSAWRQRQRAERAAAQLSLDVAD